MLGKMNKKKIKGDMCMHINIKGIAEDLKGVLEKTNDELVERYMSMYKSRYKDKDIEDIEDDLYINYDHTYEINKVTLELGRILSTAEEDVVKTHFNENVITKIKQKRRKVIFITNKRKQIIKR